ncbi:MAG TPA: PAS domain S-box protein, partial [Methanocella sp.]|nr:PAS domain S-box protein [Methanocella sp.]
MMVDTGGRHKRAEASPRSDRSRFEAIFENTPLVAIQGYDPDGVIRHWNTASTHLYGYARNEILGRRMQDVLFTGNEVGKFERIVRGITESGCAAPAMNWEIKTKDGSFKWVHSTMFPIIEDDKIVEIFCMDVDITRMKAVEEDLRRARDNLESIVEERSSELKHKNRSLVQEIARRKKIEDELNE